MKKLSLLTLPLLLAACGSNGTPSSSSVTATSSVTNVTASDGKFSGTVPVTFTNKAGSKAVTINSATLTWTDPTTKTSKTETVTIPAVTLPAGLTCAAAQSNPTASCNFNDAGTTFADRSLSTTINESDLFSKVLSQNPSATNLPVSVQFNNTQNVLPFTFSANQQSTPGPTDEKQPAPLITLNTSGTAPYSGNLSVTVSGNFDVTSTVKSLVLQVTDSKGNVDNTTYVSSNPSATFSIDTSKYPDGALTLKAIALTASGLRGESTSQTVQIQNVSSPAISIVSPDSGATLTGPTTVRVQLRQSTSSFTLKPLDSSGNDVRIDVRDFSGKIVKTVYGKAVKISDGIYEAYAPIDLIGSDFSSNSYFIEATAQAVLADSSTRTLSATTTVTTQVSDNKPPALSILMPAYITDPYKADGRVTFSRKSALMIQASDDNGISSIRVDLVCDPATAVIGQTCPTAPYQYNFPVGLAGKIFRVFTLGAMMDGQPYVQDGNYTMRVIAYDGSNANVQEFPIRVARNTAAVTIGQLDPNQEIVTTVVPDATPGALNPTSATWTLPGSANHVRVATLFYSGEQAVELPAEVGINPETSINNLSISASFIEEGFYRYDFIIEDLDTGVTRYYQGATVRVKKNPTN
ncbi:hypothetical protein [Deinococcus radiotolerans]|uniref:Ig-like domain-containing protein n=1 Tax=Deinococcus radiotolerans TaxID=1309407 RepID=A0ABQ2FIX0_9DEIO|nr:hypothetical protein [Deinococcus radiotolerans]GGK91754.1 hypothetical protein GCM10010844_07820 [Deinococcus radiotolerans]